MSLGRVFLGASVLASVWLLSPLASAQGKLTQQQKDRMGPLNLSRGTPAVTSAEVARARARKGDCAAALDAYDQALKTSIDPELHRDRGLCHEQLQHVFPAIDDYRVYLRDRPNAADADQIRGRLNHLEEQAGVGGGKSDGGGDKGATATGMVDNDASVSVGSNAGSGSGEAKVSVNASASTSGASGGTSKSQEEFEHDEAVARAASGSPLREASGWVLGPYFGFRQSNDINATLPIPTGGTASGKLPLGTNAVIGAAVRYSLGKVSTILTEFGYVGFNDHSLSGPGFFLGYEARIALSQYTSDAIILGAGLGYERYRLNEGSQSGGILNNLMPRARLGYRHVFGDSVGLEIHGDGGVGYYWIKDAPSDLKLDLTPVFGGYVALVFGF
jgi:hypothetical protein